MNRPATKGQPMWAWLAMGPWPVRRRKGPLPWQRRYAGFAALGLAVLAGSQDACQGYVPMVAKADFENAIRLRPGTNPPAITFFGGHVGPYASAASTDKPAVPAGAGFRLEESSFGQPLASDLPEPGFPKAYLLQVQRTLLYPPPGTARSELENDTGWAFRYKTLLYSNDTSGIVAVPGMRTQLFDNDEKANVAEALGRLRVALAWAPYDRNLRHAYLDVFYDQLVAQSQFISKGLLADLSAYRLGLMAMAPGSFIIDKEIEVYTNILQGIRGALVDYGKMFNDFGGVDVAWVDSTAAAGTRFGYYVFQQEQPFRNQMAAQFMDSDGIVKTVPDLDPQTGDPLPAAGAGRVLFAGYKDFVALVTILRDYAGSAAELSRLYGTRGRKTKTTDDVAEGLKLVNELQQEVGVEIQMLIGMLPAGSFPPGDASGARAAVNGVQLGLAELSGVRGFLEGRSNPLGLHPEFLVLIQEAPGMGPAPEDQPFDSYDSLLRWIRYTPSSPVPYAERTFADARSSYEQFRAYADRVKEELEGVDSVYEDRCIEITGFPPGSTNFLGDNPLRGTELWEVESTLKVLQQQLDQMRSAQSNLSDQIGVASSFVNAATNKASAIDTAYLNYQNNTRSAWDEITTWEGVRAGAQAAAEAAYAAAACASQAKSDPVGLISAGAGTAICVAAGVVNTAIQAAGAARTSEMRQQLDYANAGYGAELGKVDANIESLQAQQDFIALRREQISQASDLAELNGKIAQEQARKASLLRELDRIRLNAESGRASVANRYYADPVHSQRAEALLLRADNAFRRAQRWVFFLQRALEYKWNKDFVYSFGTHDYDRGTIFRLRNFEELNELLAALEDFNTYNLFGFNREPFVDRLSLRDDILLPFAGAGPDTGFRVDPQTRQAVAKGELFRKLLRGERPSPFIERQADGTLTLKINTFTVKKKSGFFFLGPTYSQSGSILTGGKHLDKIQWIKFNLVSSTQAEPIEADLRYGGTCYLRNSRPPRFNATNSFQLPEAFHIFPFEYFYTLDNGVSFQVSDYQRDTVKLAFSAVSREPEQNIAGSIYENRFLKERSVATSDLRLTIGAGRLDLDHLEDIELYVRHLFVSVPIFAAAKAIPSEL